MKTIHRPQHLRQIKFGAVEGRGNAYYFYLKKYISFDEAFKYGDGAKCLGYITTHTKPARVKFYSFVECHVLVNYLTPFD
jgi:hypothetical protein